MARITTTLYIDGTKVFEDVSGLDVAYSVTIDGLHYTSSGGLENDWVYSGTGTFAGFSTTQGATTPDTNYAVGDISGFVAGNTYYLYSVEATQTVTDLTNTTWVIKDTISLDYDAYNINFTSNNNQYSSFEIRYGSSMISWIVYGNDMVCDVNNSGDTSFYNEAYKTITITGGTDVTNATLISWLTANATQITSGGSIYIGTSTISKMYIGQNEVEKVYLGQDLMYEKPSTQLGSFTIQLAGGGFNPQTFSFEIGMTWAEFCNSQYNAGNYFIVDNNYIMYLSNIVMSNSTGSWRNVFGSDTIVNGEAYGYHSGGDN